MLNRIKIYLGLTYRRAVVWYYRKLGVKIGKNVFISHKAKLDTTYPGNIVIGDDCYITYGAMIIAHDHSVYRRIPYREGISQGRIVLEKNVFVGAGAIILRNVTIGENSIVSAGAVVTKNVPPNTIVAGNPARIMKHFEPNRRSSDG